MNPAHLFCSTTTGDRQAIPLRGVCRHQLQRRSPQQMSVLYWNEVAMEANRVAHTNLEDKRNAGVGSDGPQSQHRQRQGLQVEQDIFSTGRKESPVGPRTGTWPAGRLARRGGPCAASLLPSGALPFFPERFQPSTRSSPDRSDCSGRRGGRFPVGFRRHPGDCQSWDTLRHEWPHPPPPPITFRLQSTHGRLPSPVDH